MSLPGAARRAACLRSVGACVCVAVGGGGGGAESVAKDGEKARMSGALGVERGRIGVPAHHGLEQTEQEAAVAARLVVGERRDRVGYVAEYAIVADDGAEVGRLERVYDLHELGAVVGVDLGEQAAREDAVLQEDGDRLVLGATLERKPVLLLLVEARLHLCNVVALLGLLLGQLVQHDVELLLLLLLLCRGELDIVVQRRQLVLERHSLLLVRMSGHVQVVHGQRPEGRVEQRAHVLPDLGRMQCARQVDHRLHHHVDRFQVAQRFVRLIAA